MSRKIHHNTVWLTPTQAANITGMHRNTIKIYATKGVIRCKENPRRPRCSNRDAGWLYHKGDIEREILNIN